jgi:hypothetical protein
LDIKYIPANGFRYINITEAEHWVLDADGYVIYNELMVCKAGNPILLSSINKIVEHTQTNFYGSCFLEPTGPKLLAKFFHSHEKNKLDMNHGVVDMNNRFIFLKKYIILKNYNRYMAEFETCKKTKHYSELWKNKNIYH